MPLTWAGAVRAGEGVQPQDMRAGEGNRTLMTSLEGWGSTIELRPHAAPARPVEGARQHVITGSVPAHAVSQSTGRSLVGPSVPPTVDRVIRCTGHDLGCRAGPRPGIWLDR
jgi:hypothetical protein